MIHLPHLETNLTTVCQNRCVGCNHFIALQSPGTHADVEVIERDLAALSQVAHTKIYTLIGGEPTLHPRLLDALNIAHQSGIADRVEIITNGQSIERLKKHHWALIDILTVSVYPGKLDSSKLDEIRRKCVSFGIELNIKDIASDPFTAPLASHEATEDEARQRYKDCWYKTYTYVVDTGYFYRCCEMPFLGPVVMGEARGFDGLPLDGITENSLLAYIAQKWPPKSCYVCGGHNGPRLVWGEEHDKKRWLERSKA